MQMRQVGTDVTALTVDGIGHTSRWRPGTSSVHIGDSHGGAAASKGRSFSTLFRGSGQPHSVNH